MSRASVGEVIQKILRLDGGLLPRNYTNYLQIPTTAFSVLQLHSKYLPFEWTILYLMEIRVELVLNSRLGEVKGCLRHNTRETGRCSLGHCMTRA